MVDVQIGRILVEDEFPNVGQVGPTTKALSEPIKNLSFEFHIDSVNKTQV